jgi:hypothetical protein
VIHNFGRVEQVDRAALARLVSSVSRFLDPATAVAAASGLEVEVLDSDGWAGRGRWTGSGNDSGSVRRSGPPPVGGAWIRRPSSG